LATGVAVAALAGCSTAEYTANNARDDLVRAGWSKDEAQCLVARLRSYYAQQYIDANKREDERRGVKFTGVNPQGSALFVRNELSNSGALDAAEIAATRRIAQRCRS
jgi:hypothetical protein